MPVRKIHLLLSSANRDLCANGLRLVARELGTDSVTDERPADYDRNRAALAEKGTEQRLLELASSEDELHRELAAAALGAWTGDAALDALIRLAEDSDHRVRATALGALEAWPESEQAYELLLIGIDDSKWLVRMQSARALAHFPGRDADSALLEGLLDPNSFVRSCSAESLKKRDHAGILRRVRALFDHPTPYMFDAALDLIGDIGTLEDAVFLAKVGSWRNFSQPSHVRTWARDAARRIKARHGGK